MSGTRQIFGLYKTPDAVAFSLKVDTFIWAFWRFHLATIWSNTLNRSSVAYSLPNFKEKVDLMSVILGFGVGRESEKFWRKKNEEDGRKECGKNFGKGRISHHKRLSDLTRSNVSKGTFCWDQTSNVGWDANGSSLSWAQKRLMVVKAASHCKFTTLLRQKTFEGTQRPLKTIDQSALVFTLNSI